MSDWKKRARDRKDYRRAHDPEPMNRPYKKSRKVKKPYSVERKYKEARHGPFSMLNDWGFGFKYETLNKALQSLEKVHLKHFGSRCIYRIMKDGKVIGTYDPECNEKPVVLAEER